MQEQLPHGTEAREQARGHAARQAEVQQQHDAAEAALPPGVAAPRRGAAAGRPRHVLELSYHLPRAHTADSAEGSIHDGMAPAYSDRTAHA